MPECLPAADAWLPAAAPAATVDLRSNLSIGWEPLYGRTRAQSLLNIAFDVAHRYADEAVIENAVSSARQHSAEPHSIYWRPYSLAQGDPGVALMFGYFDACFPSQGWDRAAHRWVERAVVGLEDSDPPTGMFEGLAGLAFTVDYLSRGGQRYGKLLVTLHSHVLAGADAECAKVEALLGQDALSFSAWDVIAGLSGVGAYLLKTDKGPTLSRILRVLIALTLDSEGLPHWNTPPEQSGSWMQSAFPHGHLNCGLAHGIPGPLALLSLARLDGCSEPGLEDAIDEIGVWLSRHRVADVFGVNWPSAIPLEQSPEGLVEANCEGMSGTHAGWCYGTPGIARALWLAGRARRNLDLADLALESMQAVMRRTPEARALTSPALCHGFAGLLSIALRFRDETSSPDFTNFAREIAREIEALYEPMTLLGFQTTEPGGGKIDQAGLLDGAPGIAMSLLSAATNQAPGWDRVLMIS